MDRRRLNAELESRQGETVARRIAEAGLRDAGAILDELLAAEAPAITMESSEEDIVRELRSATASRCCSSRNGSPRSKSAVRAQFENELRGLTDAEQDSRDLKSRKKRTSFSPASRTRCSCRSRSARAASPSRTR